MEANAMGYKDMDLDDEVRAELRRDRTFPARDIEIAVRNGIVYVRGTVSPHIREQAMELVRRVECVAAIVDQMQVVPAEA
jgi:osmotically-inducible protein OsmY